MFGLGRQRVGAGGRVERVSNSVIDESKSHYIAAMKSLEHVRH
jgi:hypothetical protein